MIVYADIKNSAGTEVGRVNLNRKSGNEYAGIWNAKVESGAYTATIDASGSGASKTFNDALQIVVSSSKNTTGNSHAIRKLG
jgi:phage terminase large subunit